MIGIIYKYTAPDGSLYIGQTINEARRRNTFFDLNKKYAGGKIERARRKYNPSNFQYEVLYSKTYDSYFNAKLDLNKRERKYIKQYNSYKKGLNGNFGGSNLSPDNLFLYLINRIRCIFK